MCECDTLLFPGRFSQEELIFDERYYKGEDYILTLRTTKVKCIKLDSSVTKFAIPES